ncbi:MAG TPA: pilin [Burkholderiales bacterium]|nr:pilin [Burkholderiales bacterium]
MKAIQKGFTLIELMIVVAIIGILAAIALPAYQDYTIRAQVSEGPTLAEGLKTALAEYYASNGAWPSTHTTVGFATAPSGSYVSAITSASNVITITYATNKTNTNLSSGTLLIAGTVDGNGDIAWVCGNSATPTGFGAVTAGYGGAMQLKWLPASCK